MVTLTPVFPVISLKPHKVSSKQEPHRNGSPAEGREPPAQSWLLLGLSGVGFLQNPLASLLLLLPS